MRIKQKRRPCRLFQTSAGFTLVELLVVIAIIGIGQLQVNNNQREITK